MIISIDTENIWQKFLKYNMPLTLQIDCLLLTTRSLLTKRELSVV